MTSLDHDPAEVNPWAGRPASEFFDAQRASGWRAFMPADVFISYFHGPIGWAIGFLQGRGGKASRFVSRFLGALGNKLAEKIPIIAWSHVAIVTGDPETGAYSRLAEATYPRGRIFPIESYADASHTFVIFRVPHWTIDQRVAIAGAASRLAGRKYDKLNLLRHAFDNLVERLTWSRTKQRGFRPLARWVGDTDGRNRLECSELAEYAINDITGEKVQEGKVGQARPLDFWTWAELVKAIPILEVDRSVVAYARPGSSPA